MITIKSENYPLKIRERLSNYSEIKAIGNTSLLSDKTLGLLASRKCPGSIILSLFDLIAKWRTVDITFVSGFHSPLEQEVFKSLFKSRAKFVICPARSIEKMRIKNDWQKLVEQKRLLILSPFPETASRQSAELCAKRNQFVSQVADRLLIIHASENSQLEELAKAQEKFWTIEHSANENLISLGGKNYDEKLFGQ